MRDVAEKLAAMNEASRDDDDIVNGSHDDDDAGAEDSDFDIDTSSSSRVKEKVAAWTVLALELSGTSASGRLSL